MTNYCNPLVYQFESTETFTNEGRAAKIKENRLLLEDQLARLRAVVADKP
jgi:hypothetical protein